MAKIGVFTKNSDGSYTGEIVTLTVQAKNVRITAVERQLDGHSPSHLVTVGRAEIGVAWEKKSADKDYLAVKLDDPSFEAAIHAHLIDAIDGKSASLVWSRETDRHWRR